MQVSLGFGLACAFTRPATNGFSGPCVRLHPSGGGKREKREERERREKKERGGRREPSVATAPARHTPAPEANFPQARCDGTMMQVAMREAGGTISRAHSWLARAVSRTALPGWGSQSRASHSTRSVLPLRDQTGQVGRTWCRGVGVGGARLAGTGRASSFGAMESEFRDFSRPFSSSTESTADAVVGSYVHVSHAPTPDSDGSDASARFAIVSLAGSQFKVTEDDIMVVSRMRCEVGTELDLDNVLVVGGVDHTLVGRPRVAGATVRVAVEEHKRDKKVLVFKKKRRKGYQRKNGHRRDLTVLRVLSITEPEEPRE